MFLYDLSSQLKVICLGRHVCFCIHKQDGKKVEDRQEWNKPHLHHLHNAKGPKNLPPKIISSSIME